VWGSGCIDPRILDFGISWRWVVSFTSQGKTPRYPLDRRLCGPQSRSRRCGGEKIIVPTGTRTPTSRSRSQSLYRLSYPDSCSGSGSSSSCSNSSSSNSVNTNHIYRLEVNKWSIFVYIYNDIISILMTGRTMASIKCDSDKQFNTLVYQYYNNNNPKYVWAP
jgi:hypothetical protein